MLEYALKRVMAGVPLTTCTEMPAHKLEQSKSQNARLSLLARAVLWLEGKSILDFYFITCALSKKMLSTKTPELVTFVGQNIIQ